MPWLAGKAVSVPTPCSSIPEWGMKEVSENPARVAVGQVRVFSCWSTGPRWPGDGVLQVPVCSWLGGEAERSFPTDWWSRNANKRWNCVWRRMAVLRRAEFRAPVYIHQRKCRKRFYCRKIFWLHQNQLLCFCFGLGVVLWGRSSKLRREAGPSRECFHGATPTSQTLDGKSLISPKSLSFEKQQHPPPCSGAADGFVIHHENSRIFYMFTA